MSKYVDIIGWDDCPHLCPPFIEKNVRDAMEAELTPYLREARSKGRPSLGAGAIYPVEEAGIIVDPFPIPDYWPRAWAMDVGWKKTAAIIGAYDEENNTYYLTGEYYRGEQEPVVHTHGIKVKLPWAELEGAIDPAARGRNQKDGTKLMVEYEDLGLELKKANNAVFAGLEHCLIQLQNDQLKVFRTLKYWLTEYRLYRRDEKGNIVKENDHLMDCMRYLQNTKDLYTTQAYESAYNAKQGSWY